MRATAMELAIPIFVILPMVVMGRPRANRDWYPDTHGHHHVTINQFAKELCKDEGSRIDFIETVKARECKDDCEWVTFYVEDLCKVYQRRDVLHTLVAKLYDVDRNGEINGFEGF